MSFHYLLFVCCDFDRTLNTSLIAEAHKPMKLFVEGQVKQRKPVRSCIITTCTTITIYNLHAIILCSPLSQYTVL